MTIDDRPPTTARRGDQTWQWLRGRVSVGLAQARRALVPARFSGSRWVMRWLLAPTCYLGLAVLFFWPVFWSGAVPLPLMNPYAQGDPVWSSYALRQVAVGANQLLGDVSGFYYPYLAFSIDSLRSGQFPLWNPYLFGGIPYFAANQAALLYPINLLCYWLGPHRFWAAAAVLRLLVAGLGTFLLLRRLRVGRPGALVGGGIYMFAAFNVVWLHFAIHNVAALLPLALWLALRVIEHASRRDVVALAGVVAAQMFGGHPETALFSLAICCLFAVTWSVSRAVAGSGSGKQNGGTGPGGCIVRPLARVGLALALGLGLSAVQWAPTLALIRASYTLEERRFAAEQSAAPPADYSPLGGVQRARWGNLRHWLLLVAPELWGSPRGVQIRYWLPEKTNYNEMASYVGLAVLPLAALGARRGIHRRAAWFFGALLLISLLLLYPLPGLRLIGFLPLFNVAYGFRFGLGVTLAAAVLAGMGLDRLIGAPPRVLVCVALALLGLAALNLAIAYDLWGGARVRWVPGFVPDHNTRALIASVYQLPNWRPALPGVVGLACAGLLLAAHWKLVARGKAVGLVAALALAELLLHGYGYNGFTPPGAIYPRTAALAHLAAPNSQGSFRVLTLDQALRANSAMTQQLQVTGGMDDLVPGDQQRFIERGMSGIAAAGDRHVVLDWGQRLMDLMNVRYVFASRAVTRGSKGPLLPLELEDGDLRVYRNDTALPRAYAVTTVIQATPETAQDAVFANSFDPHRAVVLEEAVVDVPEIGAPVQPVPIVAYTPDRVELAPDLAAAAVVVLADTYDPGWHARIDGAPARLLRANGMFRAVVVPAGKHRVVFSYRPPLVLWSGGVSVLALAGCAAWVVWGRAGKRTGLAPGP